MLPKQTNRTEIGGVDVLDVVGSSVDMVLPAITVAALAEPRLSRFRLRDQLLVYRCFDINNS